MELKNANKRLLFFGNFKSDSLISKLLGKNYFEAAKFLSFSRFIKTFLKSSL